MTVTEEIDAKVCFSFYGTGVAIYGSTRARSGKYRVQLNETNLEMDGHSDTNNWNQVLFENNVLPRGTHAICLVNREAGDYRDLDYVRPYTFERCQYGTVLM